MASPLRLVKVHYKKEGYYLNIQAIATVYRGLIKSTLHN